MAWLTKHWSGLSSADMSEDRLKGILDRLGEWGFIDSYRYRDGDHEMWMRDGYSFHELGSRIEELMVALMVYHRWLAEVKGKVLNDEEQSREGFLWVKVLVEVYTEYYSGFDEYWEMVMRAGITKEFFYYSRNEFRKLVDRYEVKFNLNVNKDGKHVKEWLPSEIRLRHR